MPLRAASAVRTLARTETFMPMKPVAPDRTAPIRKPMAISLAERKPDDHEKYGTDEADGRVLLGEICRGAFLNGFGDFLHTWVAGWQRENPLRHCCAVKHRNDRA
jgi:hypothetical protein